MPTDPSRRLDPVVRIAPAKVNLTLAVLGTRPDGFHDLHSVMVPVDIADRLSLAVLSPGSTDTLHVTGHDPGPVADNLVLRAIAAARRAAGPEWGRPEPPPPLAARLEKRIPVAAGLAGGSSDAAAATDAALEAWGVTLAPEARHRLAAELGSDVPFFQAGGPALVEGRGERISPLPWLRDADADGTQDRPGLLLVTPSCGISTPAAFQAWDEGARVVGGAARMASLHLAEELRNGRLRVADLLARASVLAAANDLAPAAMVVEPGLVAFRRALLRLLGRPVGISGSGPTHWAFYPSHADAAVAADAVRAAIAAGDLPVPGPREPFVSAARILSTTRAGSTTAHHHRSEP
jgi:4-diphosphocytidyl-2-C-methyl-D-erythritol kinase